MEKVKEKVMKAMKKVKLYLSNPLVTLIIGFILGVLHNWFKL